MIQAWTRYDGASLISFCRVRRISIIQLFISLEQEFIAKAITLPGEGEIMDMMEVADPDAVHAVRTFIRKQLAQELKEELISTVCIFLMFPAAAPSPSWEQ